MVATHSELNTDTNSVAIALHSVVGREARVSSYWLRWLQAEELKELQDQLPGCRLAPDSAPAQIAIGAQPRSEVNSPPEE